LPRRRAAAASRTWRRDRGQRRRASRARLPHWRRRHRANHAPPTRALVVVSAGNLLLLLGFPFIIGFQRTLVFFNPFKRKDKWRGIVMFFLGILLVLSKRTFIGFIVELIGMVAMFGAFLPIVVQFLRSLPVVGPVFSAPGIATVVDKLAGVARRAPV